MQLKKPLMQKDHVWTLSLSFSLPDDLVFWKFQQRIFNDEKSQCENKFQFLAWVEF